MLQTENGRAVIHANDYRIGRLSTYSLHSEAVERVILTMREQINAPLSLEDMADIACLSPYYFSRVFHNLVGVPPGEFLATLRLDAAKRLLLTTSLNITDICFEVGYIGIGSFTTRFTQLVGLPPRHLRQMAANYVQPRLVVSDGSNENIRYIPRGGHGLSGYIRTISAFSGLFFVGLFPKPIPQGQPVRCTLLTAPGPYYIDRIPDGSYYLLVAALHVSEDLTTYLLPDKQVLVGSHGPITIYRGVAEEPVDVMLHPPRLTDPPIISALPFI